jgi:hypothetical protein
VLQYQQRARLVRVLLYSSNLVKCFEALTLLLLLLLQV